MRHNGPVLLTSHQPTRARLAVIVLLSQAMACGSTLGRGVFVRVERGSATSTCIRYSVGNDSGAYTSGTRPFDASGGVAIGIRQRDDEPAAVVSVVGGQGDDCTPTQPAEGATGRFPFPAMEVSNHVLVLERVADSDPGILDAGIVDADNDGSPAGVDCDDSNSQRFPENTEQCVGNVDEDCNGLVDCAESICATVACGVGIDGGSACLDGTCVELNCANSEDDDLDSLTNCGDPDCATRVCAAVGTCQGSICIQPTETVCDDGMDNDGDRLADCLDPDCNTLVCSDGLRCTEAERCLGDGGCTGGAVTCQQTTNTCHMATGVCVESDGGCLYADSPNGSSCDDANQCTMGDFCQGGRCQSGPVVNCTPGICRSVGSACLADGGCALANDPAGTACDGGVCNGAGGCGRFPFVPSNFREGDVPLDAGPLLTITCPTTMAVALDAGITITSTCGVPVPSARVVAQTGSQEALLVTTPSLFIGDAGSLTITGSAFPIIFAVLESIEIAGALDVSGRAGESGPGGNRQSCIGEPGQTINTSPRGGGAGGSFGSTGSNGGSGHQNVSLGGVAGPESGSQTLGPLRGGCAGGNGGGTTGGGPGGKAGGAIQLTTAGTLLIRGRVTSAGKGGGAANADSEVAEGPGGGGGGSGGAILLEGFVVTIQGHVTANGGGGGGAEAGSGVSNPGVDGLPFSQDAAAGGIAPSGGGGSGGRGGARNAASQAGVNGGATNGGGGGGGGGFGRIRVNSTQACTGAPATMSPQASSAKASCRY
jgi:hypothetical protein